eukprot:TRINITY_DN2119_c0_g1_i1.p1 TRINITY_DN2119_c0_g1~~TRINITY_DN2119_c0_g1_i1.p1  ORF type:complete len:774 (-),score=100.66 TRINITY_DN2119_c0_g1_i1:76-2346(-)
MFSDVHSFASTAQTSATEEAEVTAQDPIKVDKIHRKLKSVLVQRGVNGIPQLTKAFSSLDRSWPQRLTVWEFRKFFQTVEIKLSSRDVEVLFIFYDTDHDGELDYDEFLLALRNRLDMTQQQIEDIVRRLKTKCSAQYKVNVRQALRQHLLGAAGSSGTLMQRGQFIQAMLALRLGFTASEMAFIFTHIQSASEAGIAVVDLDEFIEFVLSEPTYEQQLGDIHVKLAEAVCDRDRPACGSVGLYRMLLRLDADHSGRLPKDEFKRALKTFGCGLLDKEIDTLYGYASDPDTGLVELHRFFLALREQIGTHTEEHWVEHHRRKLLGILTYRGLYGVLVLREMLGKYASRPLSERARLGVEFPAPLTVGLWEFVSAVRDLGIGPAMSDIELEVLFNRWATSLDELNVPAFMEALRGPTPVSRLDVIEHAWHKLDPSGDGSVTVDTLMDNFHPNRMPAVQAGKRSEKDATATFLDFFTANCPNGYVDKELFVEYWSNLSASVADQSEFSLLLWTAFQLNKQGLATTPSKRQAGHSTSRQHEITAVEPQRAQPATERGTGRTKPQPLREVEEPRQTQRNTPISSPSAVQQRQLQQQTPPRASQIQQGFAPAAPASVASTSSVPAARRRQAPYATISATTAAGYRALQENQQIGQPPLLGVPAAPGDSPPLRAVPDSPSQHSTAGDSEAGSTAVGAGANADSPSKGGQRFQATRGSGGGALSMNILAPGAPPPAVDTRVTGFKGRAMSEASRRELSKGRPF